MENKLKALFDFQRFEGNNELQAVIDSAHHSSGARRLDDDEAEMVAAAGEKYAASDKEDKDKDPWK